MKMWRKNTLAALFLFCTMFFALSMTAAAEEIGGVWKADEIWGETDAKWSYNTETKTLTISGTGEHHVRSVPWEQFEDDVEALVVNGDIYPVCRPKKKVTVNFSNGFQWNYDVASNAVTISGKGEFPEIQYVINYLENELDKMIIEDGITSMDNLLSHTWTYADVIILGKDIKNFSQERVSVNDRYIISAENPYMTIYDDCLYTKDYRTLIGCPKNKESIKFPQGVQIIGEKALYLTNIKTLIIPWGVTTLEPLSIIPYSSANPYLSKEVPIPKVILPDTISINKVIFSERISYINFYYSKNNTVIDKALKGLRKQFDTFEYGVKLDSVAEYYPEAAAVKTGWQEENGKKFYYNANGQKVSGWQKIGAAWYWFAADGSMGQNIWVKDQGKWYYLKADGVMAANQWITDQGTYWVNGSGIMVSNNWIQVKGSWYYLLGDGRRAENRWVYARDKKWYYLGKGGVMLTNTTTPDGCRVDKNGVWIR